jgi:hypothetical protein
VDKFVKAIFWIVQAKRAIDWFFWNEYHKYYNWTETKEALNFFLGGGAVFEFGCRHSWACQFVQT